MNAKSLICILALMLMLAIGCSSSPVSPDSTDSAIPPANNADSLSMPGGTSLLGIFEVYCDPVTQTAEVIPLRSASMEINVTRFFESYSGGGWITVSNLSFNYPELDVTIGLRHPMMSLPEYTIFSTRAILLTNGTYGPFEDPALVLSSQDELRLTNTDGYSRWMNPVDFPYDGSVFKYYPSVIGDPNGESFTSTLNPYKMYADGLNDIDDNLNLPENKKGAFSTSSNIKRRWNLNFGSQPGNMFQLAIVASWEPPLHTPPQIPDDFPAGTVADEPWKVESYQVSNSLYSDGIESGGNLEMQVLVWDFENTDQDEVYIEAPGLFPRQELPLVDQNGIQLTFQGWVSDVMLTNPDTFEVLISAIATDGEGFNGFLPGVELGNYAFDYVTVSPDVPPPPPDCPDFPFYDDFEEGLCPWTPFGGNWWGVANGYLDAKGGGPCYEEDTGSQEHNLNVSYVASPIIPVPESEQDLVITIHHTIDVDPPEQLGHWAWDACFVRVNGELVYPTSGPPYEDAYYPLTFDEYPCWTSFYPMMENKFNLGTAYNGMDIEVEFVLDTFDYIDNCDPPYFGWLIEDISVNFTD